MAGLAGKWMRVKNSSTNYQVTDADFTRRTDWNDTTNCESGPSAATGVVQDESVPNIGSGQVRMTVVYVPATGVYTGLQDGQTYAVTFYPDKTLTGSTLTGMLSIDEFRFLGRIRDAFKAEITGHYNSISGTGMVSTAL